MMKLLKIMVTLMFNVTTSLKLYIYKYDLVSLYNMDTSVNCVHNFLGNYYTTTSFIL